jgi:hypothetical protein
LYIYLQFRGILDECPSDIKEIRIFFAKYVARKYTEGPGRLKEIRAGFFVVRYVMASLAGKKLLV